MNSEERVSKLLSEPIRVEDFRTALINLLNEHAAEARADQREEIETLKAEMQAIIRTVVIHQDIEEASKLAATAKVKYGLDGATGESDD